MAMRGCGRVDDRASGEGCGGSGSVEVRRAPGLAGGEACVAPGRGYHPAVLPSLAAALASLALAQAAGTCAVNSVTGLAFGSYDPIVANRTTPRDATGQITYRCRAVTALVTLSAGGGGAGFLPRRMRAGAAQLDYNLYLDAARTGIWGDGTAGTQTTLAPRGRGTLVIYGRIFAGQPAAAGTYGDTIIATLNF